MLPNQQVTDKDNDLSKFNKEVFTNQKISADIKEAVRKIKLYLTQISDRFDVVLYKSTRGFGLTLVDEVVLNTVTLLKVRSVQHNLICTSVSRSNTSTSSTSTENKSADSQESCQGCSAALVQPGDVLSAFNHHDIVGLKPEQVVGMFREVKVGEPALLTLWKISEQPRLLYVPDPDYEIINFYLQKGETGFGFILGNYKDVHQVAKVNGTGDVRALLNPGDHLVGIGRVRIDHLNHDQVVSLLKKFPAGRFLQFTIRRGPKIDQLLLQNNCMAASFCCSDVYGTFTSPSTLPNNVAVNIPPYLYSNQAINHPYSLATIPSSTSVITPDFIPHCYQATMPNPPPPTPQMLSNHQHHQHLQQQHILNYHNLDNNMIHHMSQSTSLPISTLVAIPTTTASITPTALTTPYDDPNCLSKSPSLPDNQNFNFPQPPHYKFGGVQMNPKLEPKPDFIPIITTAANNNLHFPIGQIFYSQSNSSDTTYQSSTLPKNHGGTIATNEIKTSKITNTRSHSVGPINFEENHNIHKQPSSPSSSCKSASSSDSSQSSASSSVLSPSMREKTNSKQQYTVRIIRSQSRGFGFRLMGGLEEGCQAYVGEIISGGPVELCRKIKQNDTILKINGKSTKNLSHADVVKLLEKAGKSKNLITGNIGELEMTLVTKTIEKSTKTNEFPENEVILDLSKGCYGNGIDCQDDEYPSNSAGIVLVAAVGGVKEPCGVGKVYPGSIAEKAGIQVGDRVLGIDRQSIDGWQLKAVMRLLRERVSIAMSAKHDSDDDGDGDEKEKNAMSIVLKIRSNGGYGLKGLKTLRYDLPPSTDDDNTSSDPHTRDHNNRTEYVKPKKYPPLTSTFKRSPVSSDEGHYEMINNKGSTEN